MKRRKLLALLALTGLLACTSPVMTANAAWKNTSSGKIYTQTASPGYVTGWKKISGKWYYFNSSGIMQTGFQTINGKTYYLNASGVRQTGWLTYGSRNLKYYFNSSGVMQTGFQTISKKPYYFNEKGVMQKGWIRVDGKQYYADPNGVLAKDEWVGNYYFQENGVMATNAWIDGKWVGENGKYTGVKNNVGWVKDDGKTYYYDTDGKKVKGWLNLKGKTYYLHPTTGVLLYVYLLKSAARNISPAPARA